MFRPDIFVTLILFATSHLVKDGNSLLKKKANIRLLLCLHSNEFLPLSLTCNLTFWALIQNAQVTIKAS